MHREKFAERSVSASRRGDPGSALVVSSRSLIDVGDGEMFKMQKESTRLEVSASRLKTNHHVHPKPLLYVWPGGDTWSMLVKVRGSGHYHFGPLVVLAG